MTTCQQIFDRLRNTYRTSLQAVISTAQTEIREATRLANPPKTQKDAKKLFKAETKLHRANAQVARLDGFGTTAVAFAARRNSPSCITHATESEMSNFSSGGYKAEDWSTRKRRL